MEAWRPHCYEERLEALKVVFQNSKIEDIRPVSLREALRVAVRVADARCVISGTLLDAKIGGFIIARGVTLSLGFIKIVEYTQTVLYR